MSCWLPIVCSLSVAAGGATFPQRSTEEILHRVQVCHTRMCCIYQATLRRLPPVLPHDSDALEVIVLKAFLADRDEIEVMCPK